MAWADQEAIGQILDNLVDNAFLDHKAENAQGWGYAVFGRVVEGMEVVDAIEKAKTGRKGFHDDVPLEDVVIQRVTEARVEVAGQVRGARVFSATALSWRIRPWSPRSGSPEGC